MRAAEDSVVAHLGEAARQHMLQEPSEELQGRQAHAAQALAGTVPYR